MARLIDAEFIEKWINREEHNTPDERWRPESEFAAMVDNAPTVDAVEVVHGEWKYSGWNYEFRCSACDGVYAVHRVWNLDDAKEKLGNYCPNCGADMRGEDK